MNVENVNPFPVLSCEERIRYIEKQRIAIQSLIEEFGLEREVHYTTFNPPFGFVYEGALKDLLVLDLVIYEICYRRYVDKIGSNTILLLSSIPYHWIGTMGRCQVIRLL